MSTTTQVTQQMQQEINCELIIANQLLQQISTELQIIKQFTNPGAEFEGNIKENVSLIETLAKLQDIDLKNVQQITRKHFDMNNQNAGNEHTLEESTMDESQ